MWAYRTVAELNFSRTGTEAQEISSQEWVPPKGTLGELIRAMDVREEAIQPRYEGLTPSFAASLRRDFVAVIAEIKRFSPSKGAINPGLDAATQASSFDRGKAAAISVLTEPSRFGGRLEDIARVRTQSFLPILKKDFHTKPEHVLQAKHLGASAALLIVRALPADRVRECVIAAHENAIDLLVEVHTEGELDVAVESGASIIGVNARNLETLEMDETAHERLIPRIPARLIAVAESGMANRLDVRRAADHGADAVLIGSSLSAAADPAELMKSLTTVTRRTDVRAN